MHRLFLALRNADDLQTVSSYLRKLKTKELKHLCVAYLNLPQNSLEQYAVKFDRWEITCESCARSLRGFDFELIGIKYDGDRLPASAYLGEAAKQRCDAIVVIGAQRKPYSSTSLAASLVDESSIPVVVIKP